MEEAITVLKTDEEVHFDERGALEEQIRVAFKVGAHGPFLLRFPKVGFTGFAAQQAMQAFARELHALNG